MFELKKLLSFGPLLLAGFLLTACSDDDDDDDDEGTSYFRFVNVSPNAPIAEVYVDDDFYTQNGFHQASTLDTLDSGTFDLSISFELPNSIIEEIVLDHSVRIPSNTIVSHFLVGPVEDLSTVTIETDVEDIYADDFDEDIARLQFFHAGYEIGEVDVYIVDAGDDLLNQTPQFTVSYLDASQTIDVPSGDYRIQVTLAGQSTVIVDSDDIDINAGDVHLYTLVSYKVATSDTARLSLVELDDGSPRTLDNEVQNTYFRFNNAISDVTAVDVYLDSIDSEPLYTNIEFGATSEELELAPEDYNLIVTPTGETTEIFNQFFEASSGKQSTYVVAGENLENDVRGSTYVEDLRVISTHAKVGFTHASLIEEDESIDVIVVEQGGDPDSYNPQTGVSYLSNSQFELEEGSYELYLYRDGDSIYGPKSLSISEGDVINFTLTDDVGGGRPLLLQEHEN